MPNKSLFPSLVIWRRLLLTLSINAQQFNLELQIGIGRDHPPGATGLRMTMTAMHHLADTGGRYAIISMCLGSGMGMATLIERVAG